MQRDHVLDGRYRLLERVGLFTYLIILVTAAVHGAFRGLRTPLTWPRRSSTAVVLAVVLLIVPIGSAVCYDQAHANAVQQMLLGELSQADALVAETKGEPFSTAESQYDAALATYHDLLAKLYQAVAAPYAAKDYCNAITPLTYLRALPRTFGVGNLGPLATWPDGRLATSLYQCGVGSLGSSGDDTATTDLSET